MQTKEKLISKLFLNQCNKEELQVLLGLIQEDESDAGPEIMTELFRQMDALPATDEALSDRIFRRVEKGIDIIEEATEIHSVKSLSAKVYYRLGAAAAAILLIVACTWLIQFKTRNGEVFQYTAYNEIREFRLPDSSLVVLNGNSSVRYSQSWKYGATRVVNLDGEAYFKVRKEHDTQRC